MKKFSRVVCLFAFAGMTGCASVLAPLAKPNVATQTAALRSGEYTLDTTHAALLFQIDHLGFSKFSGRFDVFDASLDFDAENPAAAHLDATIDMTSLDIANEEFTTTLKGPDWFDVERFARARFTSTDIAITGDNTGIVTGELTLHGVSAPVTLDVTFNGGARDRLRGNSYVVGFSAIGEIDRTAFDISRFSGLITDSVSIEIQAEFIRAN